MRLLKRDDRVGLLHLRIDSLDDLWTLRNLIARGDRVTADTTRTAEQADDKIRSEKAEKKRMRLGVRVENVEWHDFADHLRVLGIIETGPQDHSRHHTLTLESDANMDVVIEKKPPLQAWMVAAVDEAVKATKRPQVILLAIDDAEAQFALLKSYGVQMLGTLPAGGQGKQFAGADKAKKAFYDEALKTLATLRTDASLPLLVVGPGWWREEFLDHAKAKQPDLVQGAMTDGTSQGGRAGIHEAVKRGLIAKVARDHRVHEETERVERLMVEIAKNSGLAAYGSDEVGQAVSVGAAEEVLVTDDAVREGRFDDVLQQAESVRCHVRVLATSHDAGLRLRDLSGIAALLRFPLS